MLTSLYIKNYAIIDLVKIDFSPHFSIITGETGAGKSILLGALGLLVGNRADTSVISGKAEKCIVEGSFDIQRFHFKTLFEEHDVDYDDQCIIRREILSSGKSRAFVNDCPVQLSFLKILGEKLVDIHSQHQTLSLREDNFQLEVIDAYAGNDLLLKAYTQLYTSFRKATREIRQMEEEATALQKEYEFKKFLWEELDEAQIQEGEIEKLEAEQALLANAEEIKSTLAMAILSLDDSDQSIVNQLNNLKAQLTKLSSVSKDIETLSENLVNALEEIKDLARNMQTLADQSDLDPERLDFLNERLDFLNTLLNKHRVQQTSGLLELRDQLEQEIQAHDTSGERLESLKKEYTLLLEQMGEKAATLSEARQKAALTFEKAVAELLENLQMPDAVLKVEIRSLADFQPGGKDEVQFFFSANKGIPPQELGKIASGGEISRLMLAIKSIISSKKNLPTIIFDEIDTGVSGLVADKVGKVMEQLAAHLQVIAITHLPQIAGKGDLHLKVLKNHEGSRTVSEILPLSAAERVEELAKMLSGEVITPEARQNARVLLGMN